MIFSKSKTTTTLLFLLSSPFLLIGCQQIQSANQQALQTQLKVKKEGDIAKLQRLAEQGDLQSQFNLAERYREGIEINIDCDKAIYWYNKAANKGDIAAQSNLGVMYNLGYCVS